MKLPGLARAGFGVAVVVALLLWFTAAENPVLGVPVALVFTAAAIGLWKGKAWSGYGPAILILIFVAGAILRLRDASVPLSQLTVAMAMSLAVAMVLFLAGRSLQAGNRGGAGRWVAVCAAAAVFSWMFQPMMVPTGAMEDTILSGDSLLARRILAKNPARGELVMHRSPIDERQTFVKRVVGLPGDRIRFADKRLFVNGVEMKEAYAKHSTDYMDPYRDQFPKHEPQFDIFPSGRAMLEKNVQGGELVVPEGKLFVLGDNRDVSLDSRYWGFIDNTLITGKPVMVVFSTDLSSKERSAGFAGLLLPLRHARWSRTFKLL